MENILFSVFEKLTSVLEVQGANAIQELPLSADAYSELEKWVIKHDTEWNDLVVERGYNGERNFFHAPLLPEVQLEQTFPFNGFKFKLIINN